MLGKMLSEIVLNSPTAPEYVKDGIRALGTMQLVSDRLDRLGTFVTTVNSKSGDEEKHTLVEIREYLELVCSGMDTFMEAHNIPDIPAV